MFHIEAPARAPTGPAQVAETWKKDARDALDALVPCLHDEHFAFGTVRQQPQNIPEPFSRIFAAVNINQVLFHAVC